MSTWQRQSPGVWVTGCSCNGSKQSKNFDETLLLRTAANGSFTSTAGNTYTYTAGLMVLDVDSSADYNEMLAMLPVNFLAVMAGQEGSTYGITARG